VRNFLLYTGVAILVAAGLVATAGLAQSSQKMGHSFYVGACMTALFVGILAKAYWSFRKSLKLWLFLGLVVLIHIGAYIALLHHVEDVPLLFYFLALPLELMATMLATKTFLNVLPTVRKL
jgi:hypothetical protein